MKKSDFVDRVVDTIYSGKLDEYLELIVQAANDRRRITHDRLADYNFTIFKKPGTRVRLDKIRPKYLSGYEGTVVRVTQRKGKNFLVVDLDVPSVRRYNGKGPLIPPSAVVSADDQGSP